MARGGKREGSGRKPIAEELKGRETVWKAIKEYYKKESCEEAQIQFIKETLMESQRGQIFIAEHIFGKPEERVNNTHSFNEFNIKDIITFKENVSDK